MFQLTLYTHTVHSETTPPRSPPPSPLTARPALAPDPDGPGGPQSGAGGEAQRTAHQLLPGAGEDVRDAHQ